MNTTDNATTLYDPSAAGWDAVLKTWGQPAFRAKQIYRQLYINHAIPREMTDLPAALRERIEKEFPPGLTLDRMVETDDGLTRKALFRLPDGAPVETVLMVYEDRATVCVSSQSGCPMQCVFCATGKLGFLHDLTTGQIVEQVLWAARELKKIHVLAAERGLTAWTRALTNLVFMGMGEPFNNYDRWWGAVERLHDPAGFNMGARNFTVSTVGLAPGIRRLAAERLPINLAISIHAADDELRTSLMPVNKRYPVAELMAATREYIEQTNRRVSFEYVLLQEQNDTPEQADRLGRLLSTAGPGGRSLLCHVNLIPWNPVPGAPLSRSTRQRVLDFQDRLLRHHISCTVRVERGMKIGAACGQLAGGTVENGSDHPGHSAQ